MICIKNISFWQLVEGILSAFIVFAAIWTVFTNVCIFNHQSFTFLLNLFPLTLALSAASLFLLWKFNRVSRKQESQAIDLSHIQIAWAWLILGAIIVAVYAISQQYIVFWGLALAYLIVAYLFHHRLIGFPVTSVSAINSKLHNAAVVGLCLIASVTTMIAHRSDADDAFFLSIPTALLDAPNIPMLQQDTMHGFADVPLILPIYKLHSLEVFWAVAAKITGLSPIFIAHIVFPPVFAVLFLLAQACLLRLLVPKYWLRALVTVLILLVLLGNVHQSYGNFSLVRLFQGKAVLVTLMVPLIFRYAWNFGSKGKVTDWVLLCASQIAALGITSSALFVAPFTVILALGGTWQATLKSTKRIILGLLSSIYLITVGLLLRQSMMSQVSLKNTTSSEVLSTTSKGSIAADALHQVLGTQPVFYLLMLAFLCAWTVSTFPKVRIYLLVIPLGFFLVLINPWRVGFITNYLTSSATYWRIFWAVPIPTMFAILFVGVLQPIIKLIIPKLQQQGFLIALSLMIVTLLPINTLRQENGTIIKFPTIKVPSVEYEVAQTVNRVNPPQTAILAPEAISTWIPLISNHPPLISVRNMYLDLLKDHFGYKQFSRRIDAVRYISGTKISHRIKARFLNLIDKWCIGTVVTAPNLEWEEELEMRLKNHNFKQNTEIGGYEIWVRDSLKCQKGM